MEPIVQQPYNLFAQQKQQYYPSSQNQQVQQQAVVPGNTQGATQQIPTDVAAKMQQLENESMAWRTPGIAHGGKGMLEHGGIAGTVKNTNVGTGNLKVTDSPTYPAATETGGGAKPITSMEDLATAMGYTSPQEEDRLRKASIANQRILAVGDALRHIGNIAHTINYAPSQQFNSPVEAERQRYLQGKALRDKANLTFINYQQAKAEQDRKAKQWEAEQKYKSDLLQHYRDQEQRLRDKDAATKENQEARRDLDREKFEADKAYKEGKLSLSQYNAQTSRIRAVKSGRAGGGGGKYWAYDQEGNIHYYPNRTMWEQGVYQFNQGLPQTQTLETTNASGGKTVRQTKTKTTEIGGNAAARANGKGSVGRFSIRGQQDNKKDSNISRFSIHK